MFSEKVLSIAWIALAQIAVMSVWFISSAILLELQAEVAMGAFAASALASAVQFGFVFGALLSAVIGLADRYDPRWVFFAAALLAAVANAGLLITEPGGALQILLRFVTGAALAGVYPVGMKIAVGWGQRDRGFLVGLLVGALTLGSSAPHLLAWFGGADWRITVMIASGLALLGALLILATRLGPFHSRAVRFEPKAVFIAWTDRRVRLAFAGYLGHMWELYALWAWIGVIAAAGLTLQMAANEAQEMAKLVAFAVIALGGLLCLPAGRLADRIGKAEVARWAMIGSAAAGLASAACFYAPWPLLVICLLAWGCTVIPDSAQFSALVADAAPAQHAGSLLAFQTALGFGLTIFTVQLTPILAEWIGWPITLAAMALGPLVGIEAMRRLIVLQTQDP